MKFNGKMAWFLSHFYWMNHQGYIWRNRIRLKNIFNKNPVFEGQYLAYGTYPNNIRGSYYFNISSFEKKENWKIHKG